MSLVPEVTEQTLFVNYCFPVLTYQRATRRVVTGAHRSVSPNLELCQGGKAVDIDLKHAANGKTCIYFV